MQRLSNANASTNKLKYKTEVACEQKQLSIFCEPGLSINMIRANFGRFSVMTCNEQGQLDLATDCMSPITFRVMQAQCQSKQQCSVNATSAIFGDKCPKTRKYLEVHYQCVDDSFSYVNVSPDSPPSASLSSSPSSSQTAVAAPITTSLTASSFASQSPFSASASSSSSSFSPSSSSSTLTHRPTKQAATSAQEQRQAATSPAGAGIMFQSSPQQQQHIQQQPPQYPSFINKQPQLLMPPPQANLPFPGSNPLSGSLNESVAASSQSALLTAFVYFIVTSIAFLVIVSLLALRRRASNSLKNVLLSDTVSHRTDDTLHTANKDLLVINNQNGHQFLYTPASSTKINSHMLSGAHLNAGQNHTFAHLHHATAVAAAHSQAQQQHQHHALHQQTLHHPYHHHASLFAAGAQPDFVMGNNGSEASARMSLSANSAAGSHNPQQQPPQLSATHQPAPAPMHAAPRHSPLYDYSIYSTYNQIYSTLARDAPSSEHYMSNNGSVIVGKQQHQESEQNFHNSHQQQQQQHQWPPLVQSRAPPPPPPPPPPICQKTSCGHMFKIK